MYIASSNTDRYHKMLFFATLPKGAASRENTFSVFRPGPTQTRLYSLRRLVSIGLKFRIEEVEDLYYLCSETKALISCAVMCS